MEKLIKPVEYAQELGISRQAVYAKIKRGILQSKSVDGKLYIVVDEKSHPSEKPEPKNREMDKGKRIKAESAAIKEVNTLPDYETLLRAKDETISVLKGTVKDLKKSNKQMSTTLRGEVDLLKEAFHEMRTMYVTQIEHIRQEEMQATESPIDVSTVEQGSANWTSLNKFFKKHKIDKTKKQEGLLRKIKKAYKKGDVRILKEKGKLKLNMNKQFKDILG
ncbi:MAG: DUF3972 domain-containing protein [Campylobacterota bacterium]|nr:DUF3972 domain-containing protein [Campylobacterota bacterium]